MSFTIPADNHVVGDTGHTTHHNNIADVLTALPGGVHVNNTAYAGGADPTGAADSTAAFAAALAALPTKTIWANPNNSTGASATYHYGTIILGSGTYKLGTSGDIGNLGPLVSVLGPGSDSCTLAYHGSTLTGDCLRVQNTVYPVDDNFDDLAAWAGALNGFTIDGSTASGGRGLHLGDTEGAVLGPDLRIKNFTGGQMLPVTTVTGTPHDGTGGTLAAGYHDWCVTGTNAAGETSPAGSYNHTFASSGSSNGLSWTAITNATGYNIYRRESGGAFYELIATTASTTYTDTGASENASIIAPAANVNGAIGLYLESAVSWTENITGRVQIYNCDNLVVMAHTTAPSGDWSFGYNDLTFKLYAYANQQGVAIMGGAGYYNGRLVVRANMANASTTAYNALLTLAGNAGTGGAGNPSQIAGCRLDLQAETNLGGTGYPQTIYFGSPYTNGNAVYNSMGVLRFFHNWTSSNWTWQSSVNSPQFGFNGTIIGDANLHPASVAGGSFVIPALQVAGAIGIGASEAWYNGSIANFQMVCGDVFTATLTTNSTMAFDQTATGAQRKILIISQDGTGGRTLTWPKPGSPTITSPAVYWPGGTAPTMTAAANATDVYELVTWDGIRWYGTARQAYS